MALDLVHFSFLLVFPFCLYYFLHIGYFVSCRYCCWNRLICVYLFIYLFRCASSSFVCFKWPGSPHGSYSNNRVCVFLWKCGNIASRSKYFAWPKTAHLVFCWLDVHADLNRLLLNSHVTTSLGNIIQNFKSLALKTCMLHWPIRRIRFIHDSWKFMKLTSLHGVRLLRNLQ